MTKQIKLTHGYVATVDDGDFERVDAIKWHTIFNHCGVPYAAGHINGKPILMHRFIMGATDRKIRVDHENRDTLNNRRGNLRYATQSQNLANQRMSTANSSGFKGVTFDGRRKKWKAQIRVNGILRFLGRFGEAIEAARAYDEAARSIFGNFARTNLK